MFETLAAEVRDLRVPAHSAALIELHGIVDQLQARLHEAEVEFDKAKLWDLDAATSMVAWLRDRASMTTGQAGREMHRVRALADLPAIHQAWMDGILSSGQIDAIIGVIPARFRARFADHEAELIDSLAPLGVNDTVRVLRHWVARAEAEAEPGEPEPERRGTLHLSSLLDGRGRIDGELDADTYTLLRRALDLAETPDGPGDEKRTPAERRCDALGNLARFALDHHTNTPTGRRNRPHLNVIIDIDAGTARHLDGTPISQSMLDTICCDSAMHRVLRDGRSTILDYGTATRTITNALFTAIVIRDEHCRFADCDRPAHWCDAHHVVWFSHGGETNQQNLVLLCRRHHKRLHRPGWHAKLLPDATLEVTDPEGVTHTSHPPGTLRPLPYRET